MVGKNLLTNRGPLSSITSLRMPDGIFQWLRKTFAACVELVSAVFTDRANLKHLSVIGFTYWFSCDFFGGPRRSIATNCKGLLAGNIWSGCLCLYLLRCLAQLMHCATVAFKLFAMLNQEYPYLSVSYMRLCLLRWPAIDRCGDRYNIHA